MMPSDPTSKPSSAQYTAGGETRRRERPCPGSCSSSRHHVGLPPSHRHEGWPGVPAFCSRLSVWVLPLGPGAILPWLGPQLCPSTSPAQPQQRPGFHGLLLPWLPYESPPFQPLGQPLLAERGLVTLLPISESPDMINDNTSVGLHWLEHPNQRLLSYNHSSYRF